MPRNVWRMGHGSMREVTHNEIDATVIFLELG